MTLQEKTVTCFDCGADFVFSVEEQLDFQTKGYINIPKRCRSCREARKSRQLARGKPGEMHLGFQPEQKLFPATCVQCNKTTQVPFEPIEGRPVYCRDCYTAIKIKR